MMDAALHRPVASAVTTGALGTAISRLAPLFFVIVATIAFRSIHFGDPDVGFDEPFYMLVGDQMIHGKLPYIDIWDRKPVGLFLIYAAIRMFDGGGFTGYLLASAVVVAATAGAVWWIARRWVSPWLAVLPALLYVVMLEGFVGNGGQSELYFNLLAALSFVLLLRASDSSDAGKVVRHGAIAMALFGLALQIKYTVLPMGVFFGLTFLWTAWQRGASWSRLVGIASIFMAIALVPTVLATLWFWQAGYIDQFVFSNFVSIFQRGKLEAGYLRDNLLYVAIVSLPIACTAVLGAGRLARGGQSMRSDMILAALWLMSAAFTFIMIGNYYHHYYLPVLLPLSILVAGNLREKPWGIAVLTGLIVWPFFCGVAPVPNDDAQRITTMHKVTDAITPHIDSRHCLYIFDGPTALYLTTKSCLATRFAYPDHLSNDVERNAIGVDSAAELGRILARKPGAIVTGAPKLVPVPVLNQPNVQIMQETIARDYYPVARIRHAYRILTVWGLKHGPGSTEAGNAWHPNGAIDLYAMEDD